MMENGVSLADIKAVTEGNNGGFGMGGGLWLIVLFIFFFAMGGNGFMGGNSGALTRAEVNDGFRNSHVISAIDGIGKGICESTYALNNSMMNGFSGIHEDAHILGQSLQNCCCETQKEILENRYASERNACDITQAIHADGEATRALLRDQEVQKLRDDLQTAQLTLGNQRQTETLLSSLGKWAPYAPVFQCGCYGC